MLEYDRKDISEGIDMNKSNGKSKECDFCHNWYFYTKALMMLLFSLLKAVITEFISGI